DNNADKARSANDPVELSPFFSTQGVQSALTRTDSANFTLNPTPTQVDAGAQLQVQQRTLFSFQTQQLQSQQELSGRVA
ncbi:MAG: hypothetical protein ACF8AM_21910, partial [Rhodopirellula sp. JB055]|uniref:hypothetical protein n=1 Tax=Rhodopirellula sp. JB055 TaxID=3342846 RepID=UPI00370CA0B3